MYQELNKRIEQARRVSVSEQASINGDQYRFKKRYCSKCKFFDLIKWSCKKKRVLRICLKDNLRNVE